MSNATTTIETITTEQIETLRTEAGTAGDMEQVALCDAALAPQPDAPCIWDAGPSDDHDRGELISAIAERGGWLTRIGWDNGTVECWYEVAPTAAAHACVEAIREAELA